MAMWLIFSAMTRLAGRACHVQSVAACRPVRHGVASGDSLVVARAFSVRLRQAAPVSFRQLRQPRGGMIPAAAALLVHAVGLLPAGVDRWVRSNLVNAIDIKAMTIAKALPFLDTHRTLRLAPSADFRRALQDVREIRLVA
jgi:hypothetical protein